MEHKPNLYQYLLELYWSYCTILLIITLPCIFFSSALAKKQDKSSVAISIKPIIKTADIRENGKCLIYFRIIINTKSKLISSGKHIKAINWDQEKSKVKSGEGNSIKLNYYLNQEIGVLEKIVLDLQLKERQVTFDSILENYKTGGTTTDFFKYAFERIELLKGKLSKGTLDLHTIYITKLQRYKKRLNIHDINFKFLTSYEHYLRNELNNTTNTVFSDMKCIRRYIKMAIKEKIIKMQDDPFLHYKFKNKPGNTVYLTLKEIATLQDLFDRKVLKEHLHEVLRYFLFACFTGLRISDIRRLKYSQIQNNLIEIRTKKMDEPAYIPLTKRAAAMLPKHAGIKIFQVRERTNEYLKIIATEAKIDKLLTFHVSRHTFGTIAAFLKIPREVAKEIMTIKDDRVMEVYQKIANELKVEEMSKWDKIDKEIKKATRKPG